jgi:hypothetical protein
VSAPAQPAHAHGARRLVAGPWLRAALLDPSSAWLRRWGWLSPVGNVVIVVTGGAVRLTESGLGGPTWSRFRVVYDRVLTSKERA